MNLEQDRGMEPSKFLETMSEISTQSKDQSFDEQPK